MSKGVGNTQSIISWTVNSNYQLVHFTEKFQKTIYETKEK